MSPPFRAGVRRMRRMVMGRGRRRIPIDKEADEEPTPAVDGTIGPDEGLRFGIV